MAAGRPGGRREQAYYIVLKIPMPGSRKFAVVVGYRHHARNLCQILNQHSASWKARFFDTSGYRNLLRAAFALLRAKALISFGGPSPHRVLRSLANRLRIPVFVFWAGSDVVALLERPHDARILRTKNLKHLAAAPWLVEELKTVQIPADFVPAAGVTPPAEPKPFGDTFRVVTYLPQVRADFYGAQEVYAVARALPDVPFLVTGSNNGTDPRAPQNVSFSGHLEDVTSVLDASVALLRMPQHDGLSTMVLEALSRGRYVLWTYEIPGVMVIKALDDVISSLRSLKKHHQARTLPRNAAGMNFVATHFREADVALGFEKQLSAQTSPN